MMLRRDFVRGALSLPLLPAAGFLLGGGRPVWDRAVVIPYERARLKLPKRLQTGGTVVTVFAVRSDRPDEPKLVARVPVKGPEIVFEVPHLLSTLEDVTVEFHASARRSGETVAAAGRLKIIYKRFRFGV